MFATFGLETIAIWNSRNFSFFLGLVVALQSNKNPSTEGITFLYYFYIN